MRASWTSGSPLHSCASASASSYCLEALIAILIESDELTLDGDSASVVAVIKRGVVTKPSTLNALLDLTKLSTLTISGAP